MRNNDRNERILQSLERKIAIEKFQKLNSGRDMQKKNMKPYFILKVRKNWNAFRISKREKRCKCYK